MDPNSPPPPSGLVLVDKPARRAISSMTVCRAVKKRLIAGGLGDPRRKRNIAVGHAGTLDPLASGLLIILIGRATRWCEQLMAGEKIYVADIDLAHHTETDDLEGEMIPNPLDPAAAPTREAIDSILQSRFLGIIQQTPPAYSAMLVDGRRAYKLARAGKSPEMVPRPIEIHEIAIRFYEYPKLTIEVRCAKGTYIRSLGRDIGIAATGHAAVLTALRRTAVGPYRVEDATPLEQLPIAMTLADLRPLIQTGST
jgi:tRNA pseudouridine55 synthase